MNEEKEVARGIGQVTLSNHGSLQGCQKQGSSSDLSKQCLFFSVLFIFQVKNHHSICARLFLLPPSTSCKSKLGGFSMLCLSLESRVDVCVDTCGLSNKKVKSWILRQLVFICFYDLPASVRAGKSQHLLFLKHQSFNKLLNLPTWILQSGQFFLPPPQKKITPKNRPGRPEIWHPNGGFSSFPSLTPG